MRHRIVIDILRLREVKGALRADALASVEVPRRERKTDLAKPFERIRESRAAHLGPVRFLACHANP